MLKKNILFLIYLATFVFAADVSAQILIEEGKIKLTIAPQSVARGKLSIHNTSADPLRLRVYLEDFQYLPPYDGKKKFFPAGATQNSLSAYLNFAPKEINLPPYAKENVEYSIKLPAGASGGYYGVLFAETAGGNRQGEIAVNIVTRVGALLFIEAKERKKAAQVDNFKFTAGKIQGGFSNTGDVILIPHGVYYFLTTTGMAVDRGEIASFYLPPGGQTNFEIMLNPKAPPGDYTCVVTFDLEDGDSITREIKFSKDVTGSFQIQKISE